MRLQVLVITVLSMFFLSCKDELRLEVPQDIGDGLAVGSFNEVNINDAELSKMVEDVQNEVYSGVHSILIYKDDKLVLEEYFPGHIFDYVKTGHQGDVVNWGSDSLHRVMSVTKSITSICTGIAIRKGFIKSADQSIFDYLPGYEEYRKEGKERITIEHLLTMTSGIDGNEWLLPYANPENAIMGIYFSETPINKILEKDQRFDPGSGFQYFGGSNFLLSAIIANATGMKMDKFAEQYLFGPLGINKYQWLQINQGIVDGAGGLSLSPRDMTKIGALFLYNGVWNGEQIVTTEWVERSAHPYHTNNWMNNWDDHWGMRGYAYSWWTHTFVKSGKRVPMYYAAGWGGQYIMVIPDLNTVVVFTGENYTSYRPPFDILKKYILPSIN